MNIFILNRNYKRIGVLSNQGVNPKAPYFDDLYTQELETSADTFYFSALSTSYTQDILEIGNHVTFEFNNQQKLFVISSLEFEHKEGMNVIGVYAEGAGFELLETYKKDIKLEQCNYSQFLAKILEGTGWKYKVSSSLANNLQDVEYTQEKNVYAILQDSMQTFQGVELEFEADYKNGALVKTIHAYGNGERGSFVGKRFEYGKNVKGIVKTQEVSNIKDEDIIFYEGLVTINGLRVEITYDVDFALKSVEVPEYGIGDTHYIIDNDFDPPMNIKGRIGKIEISFSDPTRNKIYLANFKKITGSKSEDTKEDDIKDIIDDYIDDKYGDGDPADHDHDRLVYNDYPMYYRGSTTTTTTSMGNFDGSYIKLLTEGENSVRLDFEIDSRPSGYNWAGCYITRNDIVDDNNTAMIFTSVNNLIPNTDRQNIGSEEDPWFSLYTHNMHTNSIETRFVSIPCDRNDVYDVSEITDSSDVNKQDLLDLILNKIKVYEYTYYDRFDGSTGYSPILGILSEDLVDHNYSTNKLSDCKSKSNVTDLIMYRYYDFNDTSIHNAHQYELSALVAALIGAFQQHVKNGGDIDLSKYATYDDLDEWCSNLDLADEEIWDKIRELEAATGKSIKGISIDESNHLIFTFSDNSTMDAGELTIDTVKNLTVTDTLCVSTIKEATPNSGIWFNNKLIVDNDTAVTGKLTVYKGITVTQGDSTFKKIDCKSLTINGKEITGGISDDIMEVVDYTDPNGESDKKLNIYKTTEVYGNLYVPGNTSSDYDTGWIRADMGISTSRFDAMNGTFESATVYTDLTVDGTIYGTVQSSSDRSLKENIRYINDSAAAATCSNDDLLEKADLHDFIVNQVNLCEYNFIGNDSDKIGFIANDYEGTKVGDKIVSRHDNTLSYDVNNLLFATIGALQEEVRIKDEKIASLEARLAKIEEMLGIDNN